MEESDDDINLDLPTKNELDAMVVDDLLDIHFNTHPEFEKGKADAYALLTYFDSIGQNYDHKTFLMLKRFETKSNAYKQGVSKAAREYFNIW